MQERGRGSKKKGKLGIPAIGADVGGKVGRMASGGAVRSKRDGCAQRGHTRGKII